MTLDRPEMRRRQTLRSAVCDLTRLLVVPQGFTLIPAAAQSDVALLGVLAASLPGKPTVR
jgi:hypothetical protein